MSQHDDDRWRVYAVDVGSTRSGRFAWARTVGAGTRWRVEGNASIESLVDCLVADLELSASVALGFEAPMYIPVPVDAASLSRARACEGSRAWCAPVGLTVSALSLHQMSWVLKSVASRLRRVPEFTLDWNRWWRGKGPVLYVWEAFVSETAHGREGDGRDHARDAATAVDCFRRTAWNGEPTSHLGVGVTNAPDLDVPVLSLAATAAKWAGWKVDDRVLQEATLVLRPSAPYRGSIGKLELTVAT